MIISGLFILIVGVAVFWWIKKKNREVRGQIESLLHLLSQIIPLQDVTFQKYPTRSVSGKYFSFPIVIECVLKKDKKRGSYFLFRIHADAHEEFPFRFYIQSSVRHGKVTHLYGMDVVFTDDDAFDRDMIAVSTSPSEVQPLLSEYIRKKLLDLREMNFVCDISNQTLLLEIVQESPSPKQVAHAILVMVELCNLIKVAIPNKK
jgi:hypothetical protein